MAKIKLSPISIQKPPLPPRNQSSKKVYNILEEIHNYERRIYMTCMFYVLSLTGKYAILITDSPISNHKDLVKLGKNPKKISQDKRDIMIKISNILNYYISSVDQLHKKYLTFLTNNKITQEVLITIYSTLILEVSTSILELRDEYFKLMEKEKKNYSYPLVIEKEINDAVKKWNPEIILESLKGTECIIQGLITVPLLRLSLLHKELCKNISEYSPETNRVCAENMNSIDESLRQTNLLQADFGKIVCLNTINPHDKESVETYQKQFCDSFVRKQQKCNNIGIALNPTDPHYQHIIKEANDEFCKLYGSKSFKCSSKDIYNYDMTVAINNSYPSVAYEKRIDNSVETAMKYCSYNETNYIKHLLPILLLIKRDTISQPQLKIPFWIEFKDVKNIKK